MSSSRPWQFDSLLAARFTRTPFTWNFLFLTCHLVLTVQDTSWFCGVLLGGSTVDGHSRSAMEPGSREDVENLQGVLFATWAVSVAIHSAELVKPPTTFLELLKSCAPTVLCTPSSRLTCSSRQFRPTRGGKRAHCETNFAHVELESS